MAGEPYGGAIRKLQVFTRAQLRLETPHVGDSIIRDYVQALMRAGYVEQGPRMRPNNWSNDRVRQYKLVRDIGVDAPRLRRDGSHIPPTGQQQMWTAMKIIGSFSAEQLAAAASTESVHVCLKEAVNYILHLKKAGYLAEQSGLYRLVNNTGGYAPMVQRSKVVFDPNHNKIVWHEDIEP